MSAQALRAVRLAHLATLAERQEVLYQELYRATGKSVYYRLAWTALDRQYRFEERARRLAKHVRNTYRRAA